MDEKDVLTYKLADLCHLQWSGWMAYLFSKGTYNEDGTWTMPQWAVERWGGQMVTPYAELSEEEKANDIYEASRFQTLLFQHIADIKKDMDERLRKAHDIADTYREIGLDGVANTLNELAYNMWYVFQHIIHAYEYAEPEEGR